MVQRGVRTHFANIEDLFVLQIELGNLFLKRLPN